MTEQTAWPPISPQAALLSSPSGRRKYQDGNVMRSPMKKSATTPSRLDRLRAARSDKDIFSEDADIEDQDDEETLQLQLAAIEAKLKLKRLQQNRAKAEAGRSTPANSSARTVISTAGADGRQSRVLAHDRDEVQVGLSPTRRPVANIEPKSPSRVLLGIDKGVKASDVSLRRARTTVDRSRAGRNESLSRARPTSRASAFSSNRSGTANSTPRVNIKSFSEKMSELQDNDRAKDGTRHTTEQGRRSGFRVDKVELQSYQAQANQQRPITRSPTRLTLQPGFSRDEVLQAKKTAVANTRIGQKTSTILDTSSRPSSRSSGNPQNQPDSTLYESFSGIHLNTRILPHTFLQRTLPQDQYTIYPIKSLLRDVKSPEYDVPEGVGDYVVFGIIGSKSNPLDHKDTKAEENSSGINDWERKWDDGSQNQKKFIAMTLTDLEWSLDLYLFGTAVPRYYRLSVGTVVAILNPGIMPPKRGREDTGAFSLTLRDGDDTILEIGTARHLGFCNAKRKDGKECGQWVDGSKTEICEWHLNLQLYKSQAGRMGVNGGTNGFAGGGGNAPSSRHYIFDSRARGSREGEGRNGLLPQKDGQKYMRTLGTTYYVSSSNAGIAPRSQSQIGMSSSRALDLDDPFIAEGQISRDNKRDLLQKRKEQQEQENVIAKKLGSFTSRGAGAEYMRQRTGDAVGSHREAVNAASHQSALATKTNIMRSKSDAGQSRKRAADSVRLSPVKKTRFVTERGIREAGRESLGVTHAMDNEDDDLDIV